MVAIKMKSMVHFRTKVNKSNGNIHNKRQKPKWTEAINGRMQPTVRVSPRTCRST